MPSIYPAFESELDDPSISCLGGKALSDSFDEIEAIALEPGIKPLMEFIDAGSMAEEVFDEEDELPDNLPPVMWYPAEEGLATIRALKKHFDTHPEEIEDLEFLLNDLNDLEVALLVAQNKSVRFHLLVDI